MRALFTIILILSSVFEAMACGLQGETSAHSLLKIAQMTDAPASEYLPKSLINGAANLIIQNADGKEVKIEDGLVLTPGMTITSKAGSAQVYLPTTGQLVEVGPETKFKILQYNKSSDQKICNLSFELQNGRAEFSSEHMAREKHCAPTQAAFEVTTENIEVTPVGTKYSVDLNQAIAEANGEVYNEEEVAVKNGQVKIRLVKVKKSKSKKNTVASNNEFETEDPIIVKAGKKAKVKKVKKDRMADIQIVYPEQ